MKFQTPEFKKGLNMTVRRGIKTYQEIEQLTDAEGNPVGWGKVEVVLLMRFCDISVWYIRQYHHLSEVRGHHFPDKELFSQMKDHYPMFDPNEIVTVVYFEVVNETGQ